MTAEPREGGHNQSHTSSDRVVTPEQVPNALASRYRVERELGRGSTATVLLADDLRYQRRVAIKLLNSDVAAAVGADRFRREIDLVAKLNHPHILPLLDSGEADGLLYYVMPAVEGESLRAKLSREHQLSIDDVMYIARDVGVALDYAHRQGVVHRDVKPENILLSAGTAVVADFGIAKLLSVSTSASSSVTRSGFAVGTFLYMSPEQASGDQLDGRADEYSLACVVYEMLTGETPYVGTTPQAVLSKLFTDEVPSVRRLRPGIAPSIDAVLSRAMSKSPADRYPSVSAFVEALVRARQEGSHERVRLQVTEALAAELGAAARTADRGPPAAPPPPPAPAPRRPVRSLIVWAIIVVALFVGGWLLWRAGRL